MLWSGIRAIIDRVKQGDAEALTSLYGLAHPYLLGLAQKLLGPQWPHKSISDLTQETWLCAWRGIHAFQGAESDADTSALFRAWLARTMKNLRLNDIRFDAAPRRNPTGGVVSLSFEKTEDSIHRKHDPACEDSTPSVSLQKKEQFALLQEAMRKLSDPADAAIIRMRFFEGRSFTEIGAQLERDESTIRYRLQRILEFLGDELKGLQ
jgi:RNA polymerase sigma factor (sigma-70 family)